MKKFHVTALFVLASFAALPACGPQSQKANPYESAPQVRADDQISKSFALEATDAPAPTPDLAVDQYKVSINEKALDKEFLLRSAMVGQTGSRSFSGLKTRIVAFKKVDGKLYLLEASKGHNVTPDLPLALLLAEFPITKEENGVITFDFNEGMSQLFIADDWRAHDGDGSDYGDEFKSVKVRTSYIETAKMDQNNLVLHQVAQVEAPKLLGGSSTELVKVVYYVSPYRPNPKFKPVLSKDFKQFGYFEAAPYLTHSGESVLHAVKFDIDKPVIYAVSENTPAEYKDAVKEGILYWNQAFGKEVIKVVDAPKGVYAPDPNLNIVQWVDFDQAGAAYADAQLDPRTGETLHSQVYMTSAFALGGKVRARRFLRRLENAQAPHENVISLKGFEKPLLCDQEIDQKFAGHIANLLAETAGLDDSVILKASQDYIREVVSHEVGHTLGLRHNFAGSTYMNYDMKDRPGLFRDYLKNKAVADTVRPSSSVMEYADFYEGVFIGDLIQRKKGALDYDRMAIENLYLGKTFKKSEVPLFCTDSDADKYLDCVRFDMGRSVVDYLSQKIEDSLQELPYRLMEKYILAKAPAYGEEPTAVDEVELDTASYAKALYATQGGLIKLMTESSRLLRIHRQFPFVNDLNEEEVKDTQADFIENEFARLGGLKSLLKLTSPDFADLEYARFLKTIALPEYQKGVGPGGQTFEFTPDELDTIKATVKKLYEKLHEKIMMAEISNLKGSKQGLLLDRPFSSDLLDTLAERVRYYVLSTTQKMTVVDIEVDAALLPKDEKKETPATPGQVEKKAVITVKLPEFRFDQDIREMASSLVQKDRGEAPEWGLKMQKQLKEEFQDRLKTALGGIDIVKLSPEELPDPVARWILENRDLLGGFSSTAVTK